VNLAQTANDEKFAVVLILHNSEDTARKATMWALRLLRNNSKLVVILDGCTDRTASIVEEVLKNVSKSAYKIIKTPDLHEIGALNTAFHFLSNSNLNWILHLQGDQIVNPRYFKVLTKNFPRHFGLISLRGGGCAHFGASGTELTIREGFFSHKPTRLWPVNLNALDSVCIALRGPLVYSTDLLKSVRYQIPEILRPHSYDDVYMSLKSLEIGLLNYSAVVPFRSDLPWGSTRKKTRSDLSPVEVSAEKNWSFIQSQSGELLKKISFEHSHAPVDKYKGPRIFSPYFLYGVLVNLYELKFQPKSLNGQRLKRYGYPIIRRISISGLKSWSKKSMLPKHHL
jgi:glycosyltransferase involved in cell wall biosynthesis